MLGPAFAVMWRGQQAINHALIGVGTLIFEECVQLLGRWWQSDQVEGDTPQQLGPISGSGWLETELFQSGQNERINRIAYPAGLAHRGRLNAPRWLKRPVAALLRRYRRLAQLLAQGRLSPYNSKSQEGQAKMHAAPRAGGQMRGSCGGEGG